MKSCCGFAICLLLFLSQAAFSQHKVELKSPDGHIVFECQTGEDLPLYSVRYKGISLVSPSALSLSFQNEEDFGSGVRMGKPVFRDGTDDYDLVAGKTSHVHDNYKEVEIPMQEQSGGKRLVVFRVKAFNDGLAFRYEFPSQVGRTSMILTEEKTSFRLAGNPMARLGFLENFTTSHEHRYEYLPLDSVRNDTLIDMPALFEFPQKVYLAITEANLLDYAGMSLIKYDGVLRSQLTPLPGQQTIKVKASLPHHSPWRVLMISDRIGDLIESNILTSLSEPCRTGDLSWLKPGKASFHWWNGDISPDTTFEPGVTFDFNKYYIDFCARNGLEYHTVIGYRRVAWYQNDGIDYQPGPNTNVTVPRPGLDMQQICDYAKSKGVGIRVWVHWAALYPRLDSAFALFQKWGIKGMMVDFLDRDDQEMIQIEEKILQKAAEHHLEIQFHGASKPTGEIRTYPNESTREGTMNYEHNKWGNLITPDDDIQIPFTRGLAGPTDYHLGGFRAMPADQFKVQFTRPHMLGTRCHMLAMYVILENHVSMVCDDPQAYEGQDGFEFIRKIPTVWDETKVIDAEPGQWIAIARRKGSSWYIGAITNHQGGTVQLPLRFLSQGQYNAEIYSDAKDVAQNPNHLGIERRKVSSGDNLTVDLAPGGGQAIILQMTSDH